MNIIAVLNIFFVIVICLIGFLVRAKAPNIDPNTAFIYFIANYLGVGIKGLVIAGLLAIIMSTADSLVIVRISIIAIATLAVLLSILEKGTMKLEWLAGNVWSTIVIVPLTAGFLRTNSKSFIVSTIFAIAFTCISGYIVGEFATISLMCGMVGSAIGLFGMHHLQKRQGTDPAKNIEK
ncbi:MAG: hypothetical protein MRQ09_00680 [Candidatus Midichloria sp.]|nr:hypothetical protein [Candidatus Midichloria sp.]